MAKSMPPATKSSRRTEVALDPSYRYGTVSNVTGPLQPNSAPNFSPAVCVRYSPKSGSKSLKICAWLTSLLFAPAKRGGVNPLRISLGKESQRSPWRLMKLCSLRSILIESVGLDNSARNIEKIKKVKHDDFSPILNLHLASLSAQVKPADRKKIANQSANNCLCVTIFCSLFERVCEALGFQHCSASRHSSRRFRLQPITKEHLYV
jgi:hypothetical protein